MDIRLIHMEEEPPYDLLLLADPSLKLVQNYLDRGFCYLAFLENKLIGTYVLLPTRPETIELVNIAIKEEEQGKGFGKQLIKHSLEVARALSFKTVEIGTANSSVSQLALYQKCGFRLTGIDKDFFIRHYEEEIFENGIQAVDMIRLSIDL
ncbi:N-acetyltransferase [Alkalihalobacillus alcalophilus ATCC 27647 = CGMCC 1.3604]|uniref:Acetyltransferase n=1 Tax=Alkalihalobacillus alcalophilus ATCC 27647 = CGMCC 1.3604 TaxID=1218173 RepID=A0A094WLZ7_ALKAL|nr:GNAT family N-acetyltransferase [Alkalihalobacillus alcalophilus]KGA97876.1 acetyltransferase [Alkalihalobacillus alcalophilus ATCC 27647 = CGMCC 1.3604]MED1562123.1 GNAT family N-acetyltransferase [Alkalihalobacillus alcalophilus]THG91493.1 N-acetyltransferase [Alkalihalobacillus alcalophilus ATCC 27647 = CGMCC 1.3604]